MNGFRFRIVCAFALAALGALVAILLGGSIAAYAIVVVLLVAGLVIALTAGAGIAGEARVLAGAARDIAEGQLASRIAAEPGDELAPAYEEFNRMASSVERRFAQASQEQDRLMAAINSSIDAVIAVDAENNITFANAAVLSLLGRAPEEIVGHPFVHVMPDPAAIEGLRASRDGKEHTSLVIERPNRQFLRAIITPIVGAGGWTSLVVFHDMTDVKRVEEVRRDFVANVSHELRTPLAAIKSVIETLESGAMEDEKIARDFLARADGEVERLVQMVEELLELSRIESGDLTISHEPLDAETIIESAADRMRPAAERAGLALSLYMPEQLPPINGDHVSLERAIVNLVHNAIKFTPEGGRIDIIARQEDGGLTIEVADTGVGIEPTDLPRVFERFFKADRARRAGGTGLGLALVKHTAEAHGGHVAAESRLGEGSRFRMWLPAPA